MVCLSDLCRSEARSYSSHEKGVDIAHWTRSRYLDEELEFGVVGDAYNKRTSPGLHTSHELVKDSRPKERLPTLPSLI
jgi:hypothetical protein